MINIILDPILGVEIIEELGFCVWLLLYSMFVSLWDSINIYDIYIYQY